MELVELLGRGEIERNIGMGNHDQNALYVISFIKDIF